MRGLAAAEAGVASGVGVFWTGSVGAEENEEAERADGPDDEQGCLEGFEALVVGFGVRLSLAAAVAGWAGPHRRIGVHDCERGEQAEHDGEDCEASEFHGLGLWVPGDGF